MGHVHWHATTAVAMLVVLATGVFGPAAAAATVGMVAALTGSATVKAGENEPPSPLALNAAVHEGDTVQTGSQSRLKLKLIDGSTLSLGAESSIKLDHLQMKSERSRLSATLALLGGYVRAVVAKAKGSARFEIESPSMVAAIRGTDLIEHFDAGATELFVAQGSVDASGTGRYAGDRVVVRAGQGVTFSDASTHTPVTRWKRAKVDAFTAATRIR